MHPSERNQAFRELVDTREIEDTLHGRPIKRLVSTIPGGSIEEAEALRKIDEIRAGGEPCTACNGEGCSSCVGGIKLTTTRKQRVRRARKHWSDRDNALGR